jgi:hypothetical protein
MLNNQKLYVNSKLLFTFTLSIAQLSHFKLSPKNTLLSIFTSYSEII